MDVSSSGIGESAPAHALFNRFDTFVDLLRWRAGATPDRLALTFASSSEQAQSFTYAQLDLGARAIAATLQQHHCAGERAVILLQPGTHYILALLGCWYARVTAVPVFSPRENSSNERVRLILQDAGARAVLSTASVLSGLDRGEWRSGGKGEIAFVAIDQVAPQTAQNWRTPSLSSQTLAVLQYTSGSTGAPKGVRLQHRHLLKNSEMIHRAMDTREDDIGVFWLPPYHDMGLIGSILQPLYRTLDVPRSRLFNYLSNPANDLHWQASCVEARLLQDSTEVGSRYAIVFSFLGRRMNFECQITCVEAPARYGFKVLQGSFQYEGLYRFEEAEDGTRLHWQFDVEPGRFFGIVPVSLLKKVLVSQIEKDFAKLATLLRHVDPATSKELINE